ncbi:hypothetical protein Hanom_Chr05g00414801 [Helianthus anomalus]
MVVQITHRSLGKLHARICWFGFRSVINEPNTSKGLLGSDQLVNSPNLDQPYVKLIVRLFHT